MTTAVQHRDRASFWPSLADRPSPDDHQSHARVLRPRRIARRMTGWLRPCRRSDSVNGLGLGTEGGASSVSVFVR